MALSNDQEIFDLIRGKSLHHQNEALKTLYHERSGQLIFLCISMGHSKETAEELFQDALFIFFKQVREKNLELSCRISTYLYSIVRRLSLKKLRDTGRKELTLLEDQQVEKLAEADKENAEDGLEVMERAHALKAKYQDLLEAIKDGLSKECQEILTNFYLDGLTLNEIWTHMGLTSLQVLKNKKAKCEKSLRKLMNIEQRNA